MTSRTAYIALSPDVTNFANLATPRSAASFIPAPQPSNSASGLNGVKARWEGLVSRGLQNVASMRNIGLLLVAASQFFFSLMNLAVKKLNTIDPPVPALELIIVRMGITLICCISYMLIAKIPDPFLGPKGIRMLLFMRGFSGFFGLFGIYYSLQYLSLSDATVLTFLSPLTTAMAGAFLLNESFSRKEAFSGIFSLIGVVMIARPTIIFGRVTLPAHSAGGLDIEKGTPAERLGAVGVALLGVLGATGAYISLRAMGKRAHPLHSLVAFSTICVIVATAAMLIERIPFVVPIRLDAFLLLAMIGLFGFVAQTLLTMGLQRETAGRGALAIYLQIIFATILERMFFHSTPSILSVLGSVIILTSGVYVALTKTNAPEKPPNRGITLEGGEGVAMEEGLLQGMVPGDADTTPITLQAGGYDNRTVAALTGEEDDDSEGRRISNAAETSEDV